MLPVVLGGIALAAVGYGVKEFCESEGCFESHSTDTTPALTAMERLHATQQRIGAEVLSRAVGLLDRIKHRKGELPDLSVWVTPPIPSKEPSSEVNETISHCEQALEELSSLLSASLEEVERIVAVSEDYAALSKPARKQIDKAVKLTRRLYRYGSAPLVKDSGHLTPEASKLLKKLKKHSHNIPIPHYGRMAMQLVG